jgi:23S rRNA G2445 N2-methylase RlmL
MKVATTLIGLEKILEKNCKGKIIGPGRVLFTKNKDLRSALIVYDYINHFKFKNEKDIYKNISKIKLKFQGAFKVDCLRQGEHSFNSQEIRQKVGEIIYNKGYEVDLNNPKNIFYVDIINDCCFFGKNPVNLGKRDYRVRVNKDSLNAVLAYSLLKLADFKKNQVLIDPFCSDGVILIEAGLLNGKKLYGLSQDIKNANINSKVAGVKINLYKNDLGWLSTLFKQNSVDLIITKPLFPSKTKSVKFVDKIIKELFYQSKFILKKKGRMVLLTPKTELIEKYAKLYRFNLKEELSIKSGGLDFKVLKLNKKSFK